MTTQFAEASYQEIVDLHTESDTVSVIGLHTPIGTTPQRMLKGFWYQFKKFRYDGCSVSLVPAARLPADPSQVSYGAGEPPIDPRDLLNPILFHGCHGNDMGNILNELYSGSGSGDYGRTFTDSADFNVLKENLVGNDYVDALYYKALTDNTWQKAHPQRGFRKSGLRPMIYSLATTFQIGNIPGGNYYPNGGPNSYIRSSDGLGLSGGTRAVGSMGVTSGSSSIGVLGEPSPPVSVEVDGELQFNRTSDRTSIQFMTPRLQRLGWMDTRQVLQATSSIPPNINTVMTGSAINDARAIGAAYAARHTGLVEDVQVPKIFMGMIMLPPAYKTEQYFRMIINHHFSFKNFRGASFQNDNAAEVINDYAYNNWNTINAKGVNKYGPYYKDDGSGDGESGSGESDPTLG